MRRCDDATMRSVIVEWLILYKLLYRRCLRSATSNMHKKRALLISGYLIYLGLITEGIEIDCRAPRLNNLAKHICTMHVIAMFVLRRTPATRQTPGDPDANVEFLPCPRLRTSRQESSHAERRRLGAWCLTTRLIGFIVNGSGMRHGTRLETANDPLNAFAQYGGIAAGHWKHALISGF
jgi:hypothetical protein